MDSRQVDEVLRSCGFVLIQPTAEGCRSWRRSLSSIFGTRCILYIVGADSNDWSAGTVFGKSDQVASVSIRLNWPDGPTVEQVDAVIETIEGIWTVGGFDYRKNAENPGLLSRG